MNDALIRLGRVSKRFDATSQPAIAEMTTTIMGGGITGLAGPDGAGKTTLLRLILGLLKADSGTLSVCGRDPVSEASVVRDLVAYMPQRFGLYEDLTVLENLTLYADLRAVVGDERRIAFDRLLAFTSLAPFAGRLAGALSGGMKQKLGLACALVRTPRLLLLDEPTAGVDPVSRRELWRMVRTLTGQGIGVVWSTAYLDEAERCERVLLMSDGRLIYEGSPSELTNRMSGRSFHVRNAGVRRRTVLASAAKMPGVIDGIVQGANVRVVLAAGALPPSAEDFKDVAVVEVAPAPPRFEDAFVSLLGSASPPVSRLPATAGRAKPDAGPVVEAKELTRRYGSFTAADRISFSIGEGEIFGLLGPNGAGKSTTFKMLCGLLRPTSGEAHVAGLDVAAQSSAARNRLGYMAQKFSLYGDLSVAQNLEFFAGVYGLIGMRRRRAVDRVTEVFGLQRYMETSAGTLPAGYKQRLALSCAVMHEPPVLFLDEPTSGVDPLTRREFWAHINALVQGGVTVMVTTHFLDEAEYCDRIALIYRGRVIASGSPDDLKVKAKRVELPDPTLEDAFISLVEADDATLAA
ncbi:MAG: ATP-binding cassette domain-containing protein [Hyphomicrobium sp.]|uniref:ATP-binding cassette domain-containing protein n=1 Tax=Hyphomicrobium sp. TaxID=82 RepID=UPI00132BBA8F|nr:ATP-binding cassette domain-containing protein [Hyphomicrobium sp.]KAB2943570.1 MAG: ABC transporter ATP-binding protein [Hyphomicrobium sp.]MBZ0209704.1 ATP-binding cassette domain-containing protein [Hyphomicrobium sp.]